MTKLPPLPEEAFDGEKEKIELKFNKCSHKQIKIVNNELHCDCGAGYTGPNIEHLYTLFTSQSS